MSGITSQQTLEMISKRTHSAHDDIVTKGGQAGGRAYGYRVVHDLHPTAKDKSGRPIITAKRMQIDPVQAVVIKKIFHMFADEGLSTTAIAAQLNAEGVPSPGSTWEGPRPKDEWRREERPHLRIIDDDLWRRARFALPAGVHPPLWFVRGANDWRQPNGLHLSRVRIRGV